MSAPPPTISCDTSGRATCGKCRRKIEKLELRLAVFEGSPFHDGFDAKYYHPDCKKSKLAELQPSSLRLLPWREQLRYTTDEQHYAFLSSSIAAQAANDAYCEMSNKVTSARPIDIKRLVEANGYTTKDGTRPIAGSVLVEIAADGLAFGLLEKCPVCDSRALRHAGHGQADFAFTWCTGYYETTRCTYSKYGPVVRETQSWDVPMHLREGKPRRPMALLGEKSDIKRGVTRTDEERAAADEEAKACKRRRRQQHKHHDDDSPIILPNPPIPLESHLREVDEMAEQEMAANCGVTTCSEITCSQDGRTAWNVNLVKVDAQTGENKFYKLQLIRIIAQVSGVSDRYGVFAKWGRVGDDEGRYKRRRYLTEAGARMNQCLLHMHQDLAAAEREFCERFMRHSDNNFVHYARRRQFERKPGSYELYRHPDHHVAERTEQEPSDICVSSERLASECCKGSKLTCFLSLILSKSMLRRELQNRNVDLARFPLGELAPDTIRAAFRALSRASDEIARREKAADMSDIERMKSDAVIHQATTDFLEAVPHVVDRHGQNALCLASRDIIVEKLDLVSEIQRILERLNLGSKQRRNGEGSLEADYAELECSLEVVEEGDPDFDKIKHYLHRGLPTARIETVFRIEKSVLDFARFAASDHNRSLLWHGSPLSNWCGILKHGLLIAPPEAPAAGYLFDKGIYFADNAQKSSAYCRAQPGSKAVLLLSEVACGDPLVMIGPDQYANITRRLAGKDSVFVKGRLAPDEAAGFDTIQGGARIPLGEPRPRFDDGDVVMGYNEYVVYESSRVRFRYILFLSCLSKDSSRVRGKV